MKTAKEESVGDRPSMPRATRDQVLDEYNHLCAICGKANPQLHHIDGDNANHEPLNLLPLCPNHHLTDQHNPTHKIDPGILQLFRLYKDPATLSPQFEPLYQRLTFLDNLEPHATELEALQSSADELIEFVRVLRMGEFYSQQLEERIGTISHPTVITSQTTDADIERWHREHHAEYLVKLAAGREDVRRLCVELVRYQDWTPSGI